MAKKKAATTTSTKRGAKVEKASKSAPKNPKLDEMLSQEELQNKARVLDLITAKAQRVMAAKLRFDRVAEQALKAKNEFKVESAEMHALIEKETAPGLEFKDSIEVGNQSNPDTESDPFDDEEGGDV